MVGRDRADQLRELRTLATLREPAARYVDTSRLPPADAERARWRSSTAPIAPGRSRSRRASSPSAAATGRRSGSR